MLKIKNIKTEALENKYGDEINIKDDLKLTGKNILDSEKVETKTIENINGTKIDIQDNLDLNNNNIINVNNINTTTINNQVPVFGGGSGGGSNGKYSQICLPPDSGQTSGNGQVIINGNNTDSNTAVSIIDGNSIGSLTFTPTEMSLGASYHVKFAGNITSDSKKKINMTAYFGNDILFTSSVDDTDDNIDNGTDIKIEDLKSKLTVYECEFDFTIYQIGSNGKIYSNGQILWIKGTDPKNLRGSSTDNFIDNINLTTNLTLDIKIYWENSADQDEELINKMVRITKMF